MNIAYIVSSLSNSGPNIMVKDLVTDMIKRGHFCKVFYFDIIHELDMPCATERMSFWKHFDFRSWDVVHSHTFRPDLFVAYQKIFYNPQGKRLISTLHQPISFSDLRLGYSLIGSALGSYLWGKALKVFNAVVFLNPVTLTELKSIKSDVKHLIYNGREVSPKPELINKDLWDLIESLKVKNKVVGTVCGVIKRKGLEQVINALPSLDKYVFLVVGGGSDLINLKKLSQRLGVENKVIFLGEVPNGHIYFSLFDFFILPSRSEGFPLALIEALGHGLPCILSDIPILYSIMKDKGCVQFFQLDNTNSLLAAIERTEKNAREMSTRALAVYHESLSSNIMGNNYISLYSSTT